MWKPASEDPKVSQTNFVAAAFKRLELGVPASCCYLDRITKRKVIKRLNVQEEDGKWSAALSMAYFTVCTVSFLLAAAGLRNTLIFAARWAFERRQHVACYHLQSE